MSLKAKIEAVIYASEEPVTLVQLVGLLGEEAQAELDALDAQQQALALEEVTEATESTPEENSEAPLDSATLEALQEDAGASLEEAPLEPSTEESPTEAAETAPAVEVQAEPSAEPEAEPSVEAQEQGETPAAEATAPVDEKKLAAENKARERRLRDHFRLLLDQLMADYVNGDRGLEIREVAGGFRLATKPEYHDAVRGFIKSLKPPMKLSLQALETLAVVAYKQPITAPEVSEIRGVDSGGVLGSLLTRKLIQTAGRKQVIGRPMLYKTSKEFLVRFGLKDINELPSIEEFEKMAGELNEAVQEEIPMDEAAHKDTEDVTAVETEPEQTEREEVETEEITAAAEADETVAQESASDADSPSTPPPAIDELNAAPEPTQVVHESVEEMLADDSTAPEGVNREHTDPHEVEPMAEVHEAQGDGTPDGSPSPTTDEED